MDERFLPALQAIAGGDLVAFERLLARDPELATARSSCSHPTLLQCLILEGTGLPAAVQTGMAQALLDAGSSFDEAFIASGSVGNTVLAAFLLDRGAKLEGNPAILRGWTVLEETIYWGNQAMIALLLQRGAPVNNLRIAAGLGRTDDMRRYFDAAGNLDVARAGAINWPFGRLPLDPGFDAPQNVLDNALVYAAMGGHLDASKLMLERGAAIDSMPLGFHYRGTSLHWAAVRGERRVCELLLAQGADPTSKDMTVRKTPAEWARFGNHADLAAFLTEPTAGT